MKGAGMRGVVIINGFPSAEKFYSQGEKVQKAIQAEGVECDLLKNGEAYALLTQNGEIETPLAKYNFVVYLDKDKYLGRMLEKMGMRLFNCAKAVEVCDDKLLTYLTLTDSGLRLVKTIPSPLCYTKNAVPNADFLNNVAKQLGFRLVVKKSYGSFGAGVQLVHGMSELQTIAKEWLYEPHFYQQYVADTHGRDIRVIVVGGKALGCMERVAQEGEFRSNIELGGVGKKVDPPKEYLAAAEKAAKSLGLDYCGVDLLETKEGPVLCEVNSNAFFEGFEKVTGQDVATAYARHIVAKMR
jgi:RimK family alpha-L-glutamate ligase